jgi:hypothetical protein
MGLSNHEIYIERLIREAQEQGKFVNLAGQGMPQRIEDPNPYLADEWRMAFKVLENGGYSPPWIEMDKELENDLERTYRDRLEHLRWLRRRLDDIKFGPIQYFARDMRRLHSSHQHFLRAHAEKIRELNSKIERFNSICPVVSLQKKIMIVDELIRQFDITCPAIPLL